MFEVIKGNRPINIEGDIKIGVDTKKAKEKKTPEETTEAEASETKTDIEQAKSKEDDNLISMTQEELDAIRAQYRMDGELYYEEMRKKANIELAETKVQADKIVEDAEKRSRELLDNANEKVTRAAEEGRKSGYDEGYQLGFGKGNEDGYTQSVKECRSVIHELQELCSNIDKEKNELMAENRRAIFDLSMTIAQKITMSMLNQKDKGVLQRMITNAAKEFRKAKRVKVTVSKLDLSEEVETDLNTFKKCFSPGTEVDFEVLEDGEKGTLQVETDSEILDAGVSTQLKMIEELGSGKYREKDSDQTAENKSEDDAPKEESEEDTE